MIYLPDHDAMFVHIPKTGGHWVWHMLRKLKINHQPNYTGRTHGLLSHLDRRPRFVFSFVRRPEDWYRSCYRYNMSKNTIWWEPGNYHPLRELEACDWSSLDAFVASAPVAFVTRMYEWFVGPPNAEFCDFVGRQESLAGDFSKAIEMGKIDFEPLVSFEHAKPVNVTRYEPSEFSTETLSLIRESEAACYRRFYPEQP